MVRKVRGGEGKGMGRKCKGKGREGGGGRDLVHPKMAPQS